MSKLLISTALFAPVIALSLMLMLRPDEVVRWQGKWYRSVYNRWLKRSNNEIDRRFMLPHDRALIGKRSVFVREAPEDPRKFASLIVVHRIFGVVILALVLGAISLGTIAVLLGLVK